MACTFVIFPVVVLNFHAVFFISNGIRLLGSLDKVEVLFGDAFI